MRELDAYFSESFVFVGIAFDGVLDVISEIAKSFWKLYNVQPLVWLVFSRTER